MPFEPQNPFARFVRAEQSTIEPQVCALISDSIPLNAAVAASSPEIASPPAIMRSLSGTMQSVAEQATELLGDSSGAVAAAIKFVGKMSK